MVDSPVSRLGKGNIISIQSHVAYGHAGNSAAVFPMQRLGYNVTNANTVLFSNHTGYGDWKGTIVDTDIVSTVLQGVADRGVLEITDAIVTGYMGSAPLGNVILNTVEKVKQANPNALYVCDPVFGDVGRGIFVTEGIPEYLRDFILPKCDICTPNLFELEWLTGDKITTLEGALKSARKLIAKGIKVVVVTSLEHQDTSPDTIEIIAVTEDKAWRVVTPKLEFAIAPNGSGDATTALFTCHYLSTFDVAQSLSLTVSGIYEIFKNTNEAGTRELQIIASGDKMVSPDEIFEAVEV